MEECFETCYAEIFHGWEQKVNNNGVIYYVNNELQKTSWNHPYLDKVFKDLGFLYADIKYAAYRTALKLRTLQLQFGLHWITISGLKETDSLESEEDSVNPLPLNYEQALLLIERTLQSSGQQEDTVCKSADLILNLIANLYDRGHSGKLVPRCIKNALLVLCGSKLSDKYKFLCSSLQYQQSGNIAREGLIHLIDDLIQIPFLLKEDKAFGIDVLASVDSCFRRSQSVEVDNVRQSDFLKWLCLEPQTLLWLPTLHRIIATEKVQHAVSCNACNMHPITGFRYRCLVCSGYNLCQNCFLQGHVSLSHKLIHQVKEYCFPVTSRDTANAWLEIVKNKLFRRHRRRAKMAFLPVEGSETREALLHWEPKSVQEDQTISLSQFGDDASSQPDWHSAAGASSQECGKSGSKQKKLLTPLELMAQPFHTSSPIVAGGTIQEENFSSEKDLENQHKIMFEKILQLQQENRLLKKRLHGYQLTEGVETSEHLQEFSANNNSKEMTVGSPISPISEPPEAELMTDGGERSKQGHDTLAIIGAFTPVRGGDPPAITVEPSTPLAEGRTTVHHDHTDSSMPNCLQYRSSDMSLLSSNSRSYPSVSTSPTKAGSVCANVTENNDLVENYKPSDMSILCSGLAKTASVSDADKVKGNWERKACTLPSSGDGETVFSLDSESVSDFHKHESYSDSVTKLTDDYQCCSPVCNFSHHCALENSSQGLLSPQTGTGSVMELSNIHPENLTSTYFTHDPRAVLSLAPTPEQFVTEPRRKTIEPVHMSTPVATVTATKCTKAFERNRLPLVDKSQQRSFIKKEFDLSENKENTTPHKEPLSDHSIESSRPQKVKAQPGVLSNSKYLCELNTRDDETDKMKTKNLIRMHKKMDPKRDSKTMLSQDRDELNQIMADFERECKISDFTQSDGTRVMTIDDSSVMAAAFNIGDALEEFVQAVAHCDPDKNVSETTEMTQF